MAGKGVSLCVQQTILFYILSFFFGVYRVSRPYQSPQSQIVTVPKAISSPDSRTSSS